MAPIARRAATETIVTSSAGSLARGFTLIELMLVLMLMGIASVIVMPNIEKGMQDREVRRSALGLAAAARNLRSRAIDEGMPQLLVLDIEQNNYRAARGAEVHLPADVKFTSVVGGEIIDRDAPIRFLPNGAATGSIALSGGRGVSYSIRLEPLTVKSRWGRAKSRKLCNAVRGRAGLRCWRSWWR
jgi:general secretion pathway protein H